MLSCSPHCIRPFETISPPEFESFQKDISQATGLEAEMHLTWYRLPSISSFVKYTSTSSPVTCGISFRKLSYSGGEVVLKRGIECGERDGIYLIDKCIIQKAFRGTNYKYDQY